VRVLYADTSVLIRAYLKDEADHLQLRAGILEGPDAVVTSELARVEFASAVRAAAQAARVGGQQELLDHFDADCQPEAQIRLLELRADTVLASAYRLVLEHRLRTLEAVHLAVALEERDDLAELAEVAFVTRDADQAVAARALGFEVR
jgi:uncharacterized protein